MSPAPAAPALPTASERHAAGRAALRRRDWPAARGALAAAAALGTDPEVLEDLGLAAFWLEDGEAAIAARTEAYGLYLRDGQAAAAGRMATWLAWDHSAFRGEHAVAGGWLRRAHRALEGLTPTVEHVWLHLREAARVIGEDAERARDLGERAVVLARELELPEYELAGQAIEGLALVHLGRLEPGLGRLREAVRAEREGALADLVLVTLVYSQAIDACACTRDFDGLLAHATRLLELCERFQVLGLIGVARAHRAGALTALGRYAEAERELGEARTVILATVPGMLPEVRLRLGELRRQQGRFEEAWEEFERCPEHAGRPLLAAALELDGGQPAAAAARLRTALEGLAGAGPVQRAPFLELLIRAAPATAAAQLAELRALGAGDASPGLGALAARAAGGVALAQRRPADAVRELAAAAAAFERRGPRFDGAVTRTELARALQAAGARDRALTQARAAAGALTALGAEAAARRARLLAEAIRAGARPA